VKLPPPARTAVCPGSYDPVTLGHVDVIRRAAGLFDRIVVGVVRKPRHKTPHFELEERIGFLRASLTDVENVVVAGFSGLVVEFAHEWGACALVTTSGSSR
jgi:pantetheine-phosphate adenylyltransferase